ncbi:MAG: hypothetical protein L0241_11445 [Planctomycetia bacterium]|nr:hypothetical protein [Planctomycetia bacterium]
MDFNLTKAKEWVEFIATIIVLIGVPVGLVRYFFAVWREQRDREYGTYDALDEQFIGYQKLCMDHPRLDISDVTTPPPTPLTPEEQKQELIAFTILFSIFERAYLMYLDQSTAITKTQWDGWDKYIEEFCKRTNFRNAWTLSGATFDQRFEDYMRGQLAKAAPPPPPVPPTGTGS